MGKYRDMATLKKTKARTQHICSKCGAEINAGDYYYKEHIPDKFLHSLHAKKFCEECYKKHGDTLLGR